MLDVLRADGFVRIPALAERLRVSESTVRRLLNRLEQAGKVSRTFGGALPQGVGPRGFQERANEALSEKMALARAAAALVHDGDAIFLGGGSTVGRMAEFLREKRLQVITNSVPVITAFADAPQVELLAVGGFLLSRHHLLVGPTTVSTLKGLHFNWAFLGAAGFTPEVLTDHNVLMAEANREALRRAERAVGLVDSGKLGRRHLATVCEVSELHALVTGVLPEKAWGQIQATANPCRLIAVGQGSETDGRLDMARQNRAEVS